MNGPLYSVGRVIRVDFRIKHGHRRWHLNAEKKMVLERFQDKMRRWRLVVHPLPKRKDIYGQNTKMVSIKRLKIRSEGTFYKAYVRGKDQKHYVIDVVKGRCRCIEDQRVMRIQRAVLQRTT